MALNGSPGKLVQAGSEEGEGGADDAQFTGSAPHRTPSHTCRAAGRINHLLLLGTGTMPKLNLAEPQCSNQRCGK